MSEERDPATTGGMGAADATTGLEVAIVGLAGRFPGAEDAESLWANLCAGVESIRPLADAEILAVGGTSEQTDNPRWVKVAADLADIDLFDAPFFELSPREAESIDPQHRLFLECAWAALEDAAVDPARSGGPIGVFVGVSASLYAIRNVWPRGGTMDLFGGLLGSDKDHLATLTSYKLDLEGPSVAVQAACSSALVAVHFAAQSLLNGECDAALAGGSSIAVPQTTGYRWHEGGVVSLDGHCRAFDERASGTVFGNGVGAVLLKRLPDALAARDRIHAVIKGSAVNNDGRSRASYTAPRAAGQAKVIRAAQLLAEVDPKTIRFVEAHGTGTPLGDPIEVSALVEAFGPNVPPASCALGSIKSNIGHLNHAAGIAGLIKATLAVERAAIPKTLHFERESPALGLAASPFYVNTETIPWPEAPGPRRAAVSSFGMGGTNAHAILEQAPPPPISGPSRPLQLLLVSARSEAALDAATDRLAAHLSSTSEALADVAYTLALGRHRFRHRRAVVAGSTEEAVETLKSRGPERVSTGRAAERRVHFLFPGQGAPVGLHGRGLYAAEPAFRTEIDRCSALLAPHLGLDLARLLFAVPEEESAAAFLRTELAQPALFAFEWSLAKLWQSWGVRPDGLLGHSLGELVAATVAGVFELPDALALVALRGRLMQAMPPGAMLAVPLSEPSVAARLPADLAFAAANAPDLSVVSGPAEAIERFEREIAPELPAGLAPRRLRTEHAFHSAAMDPVLPEYAAAIEKVARRAPRLPFVSNLTGTWITPEQAVDPTYWASHLRRTVRFADGLQTLAADGAAALLEIGPGRSLSTLARRHPATAAFPVLSPLGTAGGAAERELAHSLGALGRLWVSGVDVDEGALFRSEQRRRVTLPTYPFERRRYWIEAMPYPGAAARPAAAVETPETPETAGTPRRPSEPRVSGHERPQLGVAYVAPESPTEQAVAAVWAELFGFAEVGAHDDFFDLGGSSLLATGLAARLRSALGVEVPLDALFAAPTVARLAAWVDARKIEAAPHGDPAAETLPPLVAAARQGDPPLSFAQERLWFLDRLTPGSAAYNVPAAVRLVGDLRPAALRQALGEVVRRHETLRTTFAVAAGRPVQRIAPAGPAARSAVDLSGISETSERELPRLARREALRPFDLVRGPLLRAMLVRLGPADHALLLTVHHIVSDGWSLGVLVAELTALYGAYALGQPSPLPELPVQYADFALWQRGWLSGAALADQMEYWRRALAGAPTLALPVDRPRTGQPGDRGGRFASVLSADLAHALRALARDREATPFMFLLAAFEALLARLSGERDLVVGTTIANRTQKELEPLIGFFVNTLALRADLSADPPFDAWLGETRRAALGAYANQDLPFEQLVAELAPERDFARAPLFSVLFQLQPAASAAGADPGLGLEMRPVEAEGQTAKFDLVVSVDGGGAGGAFGFDWKFRADLFDRSTVERWAGHWQRLVAAAVAAPETRVSELPLLTERERRELITEWGEAESTFEPFALSACFAEQAIARPDAIAVSSGGALLTYGDLARRSEALAYRLVAADVVPGALVGLCVERSIEMVVGILGILQAGAAYVPLDPHYPQERLAYLLEDSGVKVLVSEGKTLPSLPPTVAQVLLTDAFDERTEPLRSNDILPDVPPELPAYVIYTSGSTGKPKGVVVTHANVARLFAATAAWFDFAASDVWTLFHSYAFDFSVWELWGPLLHGGRLEIVPYWVSRSPAELLRLLVEERVTVLSQTPSAFRQLQTIEAAEAQPAHLALRAVVFGGEALELSSLRPWFARHGELRPSLINMYGITETTVHVTYRPLGSADTARGSVIGRAIPDLSAQVVDLWTGVEPAPLGVPGEILVGGAGLALGYLGRPALTAERFVPDPNSETPGARLYRSGDLGRRLADGDLEYLGRIDNQVKVRGFRIELGEIEAAVVSHPGVRECVVMARGGESGDPRLVAYVVGDELPSLSDLRSYLGARLPDYMVPTALVPLAALPLTAHGKVDRRALPSPEHEARSERLRVAPRTPLEHWLVGVWAENLGVDVESVGVEDDFFEQGGNSIRGAVLINRLQQDLGEIVQVVVIFDHPTVAALSGYIELEHPEGMARMLAALAAGSAPEVETIPAGLWREGEPLALSFAQERLWFLDRLAPGSAAYNIQSGVRLQGALDASALAGALGQVMARHAILRARFGAGGKGPVQTILPARAPRVPRLDLSSLGDPSEREAQRLTTLDARRPFDLSHDALVRLTLVRLGPEDHLGLFSMHHIVGDGWSMGVLIREVGALYAAGREGRAAELPALSVQYPDFALWQQARLTPQAMASELGYWRQMLAGLVPLPLPADRPRPPMLSADGGLWGFVFTEETVAGLDRLAREQGLTRYMALLASFQALLARLSGEHDVAVGSTVAGRTRRELEPLIGFFVNTLVLRARLAESAGFSALLRGAREVALGAFAHQEVPFERVVAELQPERDLSRSPLFQVMFQLQNARAEVLDLSGLQLSSATAEGATSKFDLVVNLRESPAGIAGAWRYSLDLFDRSTLARWSSHWEHLLAAAVAEPETPFAELPLLSEGERKELITEWGTPESTFEPFALSARFAEQAAAWPDAIAVSLSGAVLTYGELSRRSQHLAHRLIATGVAPGDLVALSLERSIEMVVAILGILRAGAAYLPLDPHYPQERLAYLLEDSGVKVLVSEGKTLPSLPPTPAHVLLTDAFYERTDSVRSNDILPDVPPDLPAYVIYTSGSTGKPKGVVVTHANVARLFVATAAGFDFAASDVWTLFHSYAFDFSVWELWGPLLHGGRLEIVPYWVSRSPVELLKLLVEERVTVLNQTPSAFRQLQAIEAAATPADFALRAVVFGGEALELSSLRPWFARHGEVRPLLVNMYGITETTVHVTYRPIGKADMARGSVVGRAIPDLSAQVVDLWNRTEPAPVGVPGEIQVGGAGLALGYLGRPELTAARFVPHPASATPGARLYRSGDLGRRLPDGDLEYLGRIDTQVKVRGFRIELGEIEAAVLSHPGVRECVVLARGEENGDPRLVAYAVGGELPSLSDLRAYLGARLPDYMVPTALVPLDALPLTAHGKVDRRALPSPEQEARSERLRVPPRTPLEVWLAGVWAENLGLDVEFVGVEDDFFEQGGNSIRGAVLINRLQQDLGEIVQVVVIFDHPTIASLGRYVEVEHQDAAARLLAALAAGDEPAAETIPTGLWREEEPHALSFAQERLWFLDRLAPGSAAYNIQSGVRLRGPLDAAALVGALGRVVARHAILRARFGTGGEGPVQIVGPITAPRVPRFDLSALGSALGAALGAAEREAQRLTTLEARRPFDLSRGGLVRLALVRLGPEDHLGLFAMHHIVGDGWSMGLLVHEVGALYSAFRAGTAADLPALAAQYPDFALWQRAHLTPDAVAAELGYWRQVLAGLVPLPLPADRPRPPMLSPEGGLLGFAFAEETVAGLDLLAREQGLTRYMALLASFQALIARISGESDVAVGSTVAGRTRRELEPLIGFFVNTLVLRARLAADAGFTSLLSQAREVALGAFAHQEVPFERVVAELQPERDLSRSPLFQVMFQLQNARTGVLDLAGLELSTAAAEGATSKFDLVVNLRESPAGIAGTWRYSLDLFDRSTLARWSGHWEHLLAAAVAEPERRLAELPLLSESERGELVARWGEAESAFAPFALSARFAEQAAIRPDAIAVSLSGAVLTYGDLARRSENLGRRLLVAGVVPGDLVGLCVERSIEMVVGILGILKAGAAYVPLDPHYPLERLAYLLEDSGVRVLVAERRTLAALPKSAARTVLLDGVAEPSAWTRRLPAVAPEQPAYVIYTSGSTGKPKGVVVTHGNVARLFAATESELDFGPADVWTLFHSYAFDFSVWELWGALLYGGRLEIVPYWLSRSPGELLRLLIDERVTVLSQTPSAFRQLQAIEAALPEAAAHALSVVVFGGEALDLSSLRPWIARHGEDQPLLVNMYGITETTVHVTYRPLGTADLSGGSVVGPAIPDLSAQVVDLWNGVEPAPVGVPGEIRVGGAGLALGYLGRPELTAERFVPDPNAQVPGARLYRSGDLGRRMPDGELEYLGRIDTQVKVRGFRIELGEIEAAVLSHPSVRECVVLARGGESGDPRLVAYAVGDHLPSLSDLRAYLGARLPDYMVPTALVPLDALPLTAHGKVDRRALPSPDQEARSERLRIPPRTSLEVWLAGVWAENLGLNVESVGVEDDFFEQGGNSIRGAVLINRLQQDLGEIVQVVVIFDHPTIASLGRYVEMEHQDAAARLLAALAAGEEPAVEMIPTGLWREGEPLALSFAQERLWFLDRLAPGSAAYNIQSGVRLRGPLDAAALVGALGRVVARHAILRARFGTGGAGPVQTIDPVAVPRVPRFDLSALGSALGVALGAAEREGQRLTTLDARRPFDLGAGGLVRLALVRLGPEDHLGLFAMHHIVGDGWSMGLLVQEVGALYAAARESKPANLPALAVQYPDYALWQQAHLTPDAVAVELGYWREVLTGAVPLPLPTDRPRPLMLSPEGGLEGFSFSEQTVAGLDRLAREHGLTRYMALLGSFQALLARISGESDVAVGSTVAGRTRRELEPLIGFFVNTLVLRARLPENADFGSLLGQAREVALGAFAHQEVPFERVVAELQPERDLSRSPLFQVMFQLQNARAGSLDLAGLELSSAAAAGATSKFDLVVNLRESPAGIAGVWRYSLDLFDRPTLARWSSHWQHLLAAAAAEPERRISELPLLSDTERGELIAEWGKAEGTFTTFTLSERFAEQAAARPDAVAVSLGGAVLTYGELARRTEALAHRLIAADVVPGALVGLCVERSIEMVVAILGILRAGAAYVPLDPHYPQERLAYLLEDSGVKVLVSEGKTLPSLPPTPAHVLLTDAFNERTDPVRTNGVLPDVPPELPAYVIYTSGSTGKPKGVVVTHANVARLFAATEPWFEFSPSDVWTLFHSYAFDFSVWELWGPLLHGGRLEIVPYWVSRSPSDLLRLLVEERVTFLNQTPSAFRQLQAIEAAEATPADLALRAVVFGGEALELKSLRPWFARHGEVRPVLVNMYGITETTVHVTHRPIGAADAARGSVIGRAIPDLTAQVVDLWNRVELAPVGVPGEILVGGAGLALGYLGRPELTAERFVPDPQAQIPGARLYRSGDLGRRMPDGDLEYLGRIDTQVKVRGFRIEVGEIEAAILAHPGVRECVVVARGGAGGDPGDPRLVAYAVGSAVPTLSDLRAFLGARLPDYMVPSALGVLTALPLTANGKADRRALPALETEERLARERVTPRTPLESWLASAWAEVLGIDLDRVGVEDDFFEQGGNSIRGAVLINRLQQDLGEIVQVVVIFDHPTIAGLAGYLTAEHAAAVERLLVARGAHAALSVEMGAGSLRVDEAKLAALAALVRPLGPPPATDGAAKKNPPVLFVLSPPRSGTTLLRVMLAGHPQLFAPPELELLTFRTMGERRAAFSGRDSFWLEGVLRAVMEIRGGTVEEAREFVAESEDRDLPTEAFYGLLEAELAERMLVDKTPSYALDPEVLRRGEAEFAGARYLHLVRHPGGMIRSFEEAKLDQIFFRRAHSFGRRELAELIWTASHRNILDFLAEVPNERHHRVIFEELVRDPERVLAGVCEFLGLPFEPAMAAPYEDGSSRRMTDGPHAASRALGDVKFLGHGGVKAGVAERWREQLDENELGDPTLEVASDLGYEAPPGRVRERAIPARRKGWPAGSEAPLSFAQERLWFLDRLMPGSPAYNLPIALRLGGGLDVRVLRSSLSEIVRRHAILRTTYGEIDGRPLQRIGAAGRFPLALADLSALLSERAEKEGARAVATEARRPFDLARGPIARGLVIRFAASEHGLLLRLHHIAADGWSLGVLVRELVTAYAALAEGRAPDLPALPLQYADYALWQRGRRVGERLEREIAYWRERLAGAPPIALPTDRPRRPARPIHGGRSAFALPAGAFERLAEECRRAGATPFMGLLAAFAALLHRWTGQDDLSLGTPVAGRHRAEVEGAIGLFVNTLVLRVGLEGAPTWRELIARARAAAVGAFAHQELPFEKVVEELAPVRDLSTAPLFQVGFSFQNAAEEMPGGAAGSAGGLTLARWRTWEALGKFDLALTFSEPRGPGDGLAGGMEYDRELFDSATIGRLGVRFANLLARAGDEPDRPLAELPATTLSERHQTLLEWNDVAAGYPFEVCLHALVEAQVDRTPQALAIVDDETGEELTYADLDARANRLARHLAALGVDRSARVAIAVERSAGIVVAILGTMKAGAAYVPLDPSYPADRLAFMLADSAAAVLIVDRRSESSLPPFAGPKVRIDDAPGVIAEWSPLRLATASRPDDLAYVIYTSGSTGRPKGVMVAHAPVANCILYMQEHMPLVTADRLLQKTPYGFDASVWELFWPLIAGAQLVIARPDGHRDPAYLVRVIRERAVTVLQAVPSLLEVFSSEPGVEECRSLRQIYSGGEALSADLLARLLDLGAEQTYNVYGPTEATMHASMWRATREADKAPIGRPVGNARFYVVDAMAEPTGLGVAGELWIGGEVLARGYWDRADLTAERFLPDSWSEVAGARAYRTGDLVRHRADGNLAYLGRIDHQVKLRGQRIELGEIEAQLRRHPAVAQAVVVLQGAEPGGPQGEPRLVAYLVPSPGAAPGAPGVPGAPGAAELRAFLAAELPDTMVPKAFVTLDLLPMMPSGKVDLKALPAPEPESAEIHQGPRTPIEEIVAAIWCEVLERDAVGVGEDFFALGGHSLLATRVVARVRGSLGVDLPVRALFEQPTIAALAREIDRMRNSEGYVLAPELSAAARDERRETMSALPVSFAQQRLWFLHQLEPESPAYHLSLALRLAGALDFAALAAALTEIARRHEALRTRFPAPDGEPTQEIVPAETFAARPLPLVDLSTLPAEPRTAEARRRVAAEAALPFDLAAGPVSRTTLLRLGVEEHVGLLTQHHIVSDAWSRGILLSELSALYAAAREGRPSPLPPLPIQYADFALWQRAWLRGEVLERQLDYWRRQLGDVPHALDLPADRPRPPRQSFRGAARAVRFSAELSSALRAFARSESATPYMVGLALFQALLCRWTGRSEVLVGSPVANRERVEVEGLIGFFANTLVLRGGLGSGAAGDLRAGLKAARETVLEATAHQDLPFEKLVEELKPERDPSRSPLVQVLYTLLPQAAPVLALPGLEASPLLGASGTSAKFDLTLSLIDAPAGIGGGLEFSTALFDPTTAARMVGQIEAWFAAALGDPTADLAALPLLSLPERHQIAVEWNDSAPRFVAEGRTIGARIAEQARRDPDRVAVVGDGVHLSYGELERRARSLAQWLNRDFALGAEARVGLCVGRTPTMLVGLLGVWFAGGAYVPLDPAYPMERLRYMLADSGAAEAGAVIVDPLGASVLVSHGSELRAGWPREGSRYLRLDETGSGPGGTEDAKEAPVQVETAPANLAYVIYTSGSTGRPKGVAISHGALGNFLDSMADQPGLTAGDALLAVTSPSFDIAGLELFLPLLAGARIELASREEAMDGQRLRRRLAESGATLMQATPSTWRLLIDAGWPGAGGGEPVRVLVGGEALPDRLAAELCARSEAVWNLYGPTETTIWSALARVDPAVSTIGRPIASTRLEIADGGGEPVPIGVPAELRIGGAGVARGYLGRPELTAERFVPDPPGGRAGSPGARAYRTGDLARWRPDGSIEFLGRIDNQVKVRGFRIELGEVEAALAALPGVAQAVASVRGEGAARVLVGYLVAAPEAATESVGELRAVLALTLPEPMIPNAFVHLAALPLTPNGKVDRGALPAPGLDRGVRPFASPRDTVEEVLAAVWAEVLGLERVGIDEDFFDLGGHSLLATRVVSRIHKVFRMDLPLRDFFGGTTVEGLAKIVQGRESRPGRAEKIARLYLSVELLPDEGVRDQLAARREQDGATVEELTAVAVLAAGPDGRSE